MNDGTGRYGPHQVMIPRVRRPHKVMHIRRDKMPLQIVPRRTDHLHAGAFISIPDLRGILQITRTPENIAPVQDGLLHVERLGYAIYRKRDYFLIADLLRRKVLNTISYTRVPVLVPVTVPAHIGYLAQLTAMHIHHATWLKSIPVQVVEHLP